MTEEEVISRLNTLSPEQLDEIQDKLQQKIRDRDAERERLKKLPPRNSNDLSALADMQGLDLSSLMKDMKGYR